MSRCALVIARKELARFFSSKASALVSIVLPGLLIFFMWTFMGDAMGSMFAPDEAKRPVVAVVNEPASVAAFASSAGIDTAAEDALPGTEQMRERIAQGDVQAFAGGRGRLRPRVGRGGAPGGGVLQFRRTRLGPSVLDVLLAARRLRVVAVEPL